MRTRKYLAAFMALTMLIAMLAGCASTSGTTAPTTAGPATQPSTEAPTQAPATAPPPNDFTKFDPPVTITTAIALRSSDTLRNGDTPENNPISRWMRDTLGIIIKYKWTVTDADNAMKTRVQLALTSGEELPDILAVSYDDLLANLIESGKIQPIDEAYDKYATERVKYAYDQNSIVWNFVRKDGQKWALPQIADGFVGDTILWIRQDWLDRKQLKAPTTLQEFEALLEAFTNGDPDGNGQPDTYGVAIGGNSGFQAPLQDWMGDMQFLFGQRQPYVWLKNADGKLTYGSIDPVVKQGLGVLQDWYKKGYLSPDFITHNAEKAAGEFTSGQCGMIFAPGWCGGWPIGDAVTAAQKDGRVFDAQPYPIPSGLNGDIGRNGSTMSYLAYVFRSGFDRMDAIFRLWDIRYGSTIEDPDYPFAAGIEGYDVITMDGKPSWNSADIPDGSVDLSRFWLLGTGNTPPRVMEGPNIYERVMSGDMDSVYEQKLNAMNGELFIKGTATVFLQMDKDVPILFVGLPTKTMVSSMANLKTLDETTQFKIITGEKPLDYFDEFVQQWLAGGGTQITQEVNDWYAAVSK